MTTGEGALEALVLAAGSGRRFGGGKLTRPWRGGLLIDGALAAAFAAPVRTVRVVTGADPAVTEAAMRFATARGQVLRLIYTPSRDHALGLSASLADGVVGLPRDAAGVFVFLGDMPAIPEGVAARLAEALGPEVTAAAPTFGGKRGHPVLFGKPLFAELIRLTGDRGARDLLDGLGSRLALVEAPDNGILIDIDTPADLARQS